MASSGDRDLAEKLRAILEHECSKNDIPGLTASVVHESRVACASAGVVDLGAAEGTALTSQHVLHCASLAKVFVAAAVMQLVEQQQLSLTDKVVQHIPYFKLLDPVQWEQFEADTEASATITIQQMLTHTAGMPDIADEDYNWGSDDHSDAVLEEYVHSLEQRQMIGPPGHIYMYSNIAFNVLAHLIAKVSGVTFEEYVQEHIFQRLGMHSSTFFYPEVSAELRTTAHRNEPAAVHPVYPYNRVHAGSSTLNTSAEDMSHFMLAMLQGGQCSGSEERFLSAESIERMWTETERGRFFRSPTVCSVGLSWWLDEHKGHRVCEHEGEDDGFCAYIALLPETGTAVFLASNWEETDSEEIAYRIVDSILGLGGGEAAAGQDGSSSSSDSSEEE